MHWKELQKGISDYAKHDERLRHEQKYSQALAHLKWDGTAQTISSNLEILNQLLDSSDPQVIRIDKIKDVWLKVVEPLADCIEDVFLERHGMLKAVDKKDLGVQCVGQAIERMYNELKDIQFIGPTNASRLLHLRFPRLFVMIDEGTIKYWLEDIRLHELFGIQKAELFRGYGYTFIFLPFIKSHAVDAIMSYASDQGTDIKEAIGKLQNLGGRNRTIAKLMEEYYYAITR